MGRRNGGMTPTAFRGRLFAETLQLRKLSIITAFLALLLAACAQNEESVDKGEASAPRRVLVAGPQSEFKRAVMERVADALGARDYYLKIAGLDALAAEDTGAYGAVVVLYAVPDGQMDERVRRFLEKNPGNPKVIVFYTKTAAGQTAAESSAALLAQADRYADQLVALIRKRFE
jgi:sugar (pentulose or hexulose) kinase